MNTPTLTIRQATPNDLPYIIDLQRKNRESVGGLPKPAFEERIAQQTLLLGLLNNEPCGYLLYDYRNNIIKIPQACIQYDARRRQYGIELVATMMNLHPHTTETRLRCAADIEANLFWQSLGFVCVGVTQGGTRRGRLINIWQRWHDQRLFIPHQAAVTPAWQQRQDCKDQQTGFITEQPTGFHNAGQLPKLAWANRKPAPATGSHGENRHGEKN